MSTIRVTIYRDGQIYREFTKPGLKQAMTFAAHELGKAVEHLTIDKKYDVHLDTTFLTRDDWSATLTVVDDEIFGITVEKMK